jgi:hypothetical protein
VVAVVIKQHVKTKSLKNQKEKEVKISSDEEKDVTHLAKELRIKN